MESALFPPSELDLVEPDVPWFEEYAKTITILGTGFWDVRNLIKACAEGEPTYREGIHQLIEANDLTGLAEQLARETPNMSWLFRDDPQGEVDMRCILERIQGMFFTHCFLEGDQVVYLLTEEADRQQRAHYRRRVSDIELSDCSDDGY